MSLGAVRLGVWSVAIAGLAAALVGCGGADSSRQVRPAGPASLAVLGLFEAVHATDWVRCSQAMHPDALNDFDRAFRPRLLAAAQAGQQAQVLSLVNDVGTLDALKALSPERFFVQFMQGRMKAHPPTAELLRASSTEVLGEVPEGQDLIHVVYRTKGSIGGLRFQKVGVISVRRHEQGWKPLLSDELKQIGQA